MSTPLIAPDGVEWPDLTQAPDIIAAWEQAAGCKLPAAYRSFMLGYGGGRIYPSMFVVDQPPEIWGMADFCTFCDPLYDWDYAVSLWNGETYLDARPKDFFFIGCNPGGLEILMSLRPADYGCIYTWWGRALPWGENGNDQRNVYLQAGNFTDFIDQMFENESRDAYAYWATPRHKMLARELVLR